MKTLSKLVIVPLCHVASFAVPSESALAAIAECGPIVEMGAGSGYWTALLQHRAKEVARAALTLALRAVSCVSIPELNGLLPALVPALTRCNAGRARVRYVFERLVQRCGSEAVVDAIPPSVGGFWRSRRGLTALKPKAKSTN